MAGLGPQRGAFESALHWLGRPGFAVRDILTGNLEGAARQGADFIGDAVDSVLPGDWVPEFSREQDNAEFSDVLRSYGVADLKPGWGKTLTDIGGGIATDPLTFVGLGPVTAGIKAAGKVGVEGVKMLPRGAEAVAVGSKMAEDAGRYVRKVAGAQRIDPALAPIINNAQRAGNVSAAANEAALKNLLGGVGDADRQTLTNAIRGRHQVDGTWKSLEPTTITNPRVTGAQDVIARTGTGDDAALAMNQNAALPDSLPGDTLRYGDVYRMLGAVNRTPASRIGGDLAKPLDVAGMKQGGIVAPLEQVGAADLPQRALTFQKFDDQMADITRNLDAMGTDAATKARILPIAEQWVRQYSSGQFREAVEKGAFRNPIGEDMLTSSPRYVQDSYSGFGSGLDETLTGMPSTLKEKTLREAGDQVDFLNNNPGITVENDLAKLASERAGQQSRILTRTAAGKGLIDREVAIAEGKLKAAAGATEGWEAMPEVHRFAAAKLSKSEQLALSAKHSALVDPEFRAAASAAIKQIAVKDPETAQVLTDLWSGLPPRGGFTGALAKVNSFFKPYATAGAILPRINFTVRNVLTGGIGQALSTPEARKYAVRQAMNVPQLLIQSVDDGIEHVLGRRVFGKSDMADLNNALAQSNGRVDDAIRLVQDPTLKEALGAGVITNGFIRVEQLVDSVARTGWSKRWRDIRDWPSSIAAGSEQRMRFGLFKAMRQDGKSVEDASRVVKDAYFDYNIASQENRAARDVIPFFQFSAKAIPQATKLFMESGPAGALARGIVRPLYGQDSETNPIYPYMQNGINIPLGEGDDGKQQYITSLGLPLEALATLPNLSDSPMTALRQVRQGVLGQGNPLLKTGFSALAGVDPYFGTPFASYDKTPEALQALGAPERSEFGRAYNLLKGTGVIQQATTPFDMVGTAAGSDDSMSKILNLLTGVKVRSVDEDLALRQQVDQLLKERPDVQRATSFYSNSEDPESAALLDQLRTIKSRMRQQKKMDALQAAPALNL